MNGPNPPYEVQWQAASPHRVYSVPADLQFEECAATPKIPRPTMIYHSNPLAPQPLQNPNYFPSGAQLAGLQNSNHFPSGIQPGLQYPNYYPTGVQNTVEAAQGFPTTQVDEWSAKGICVLVLCASLFLLAVATVIWYIIITF